MTARRKPDELRSHRWFGQSDMRGFGHHSRAAQMGYSRADYQGKPIIAIVNTWSDINQCHAHFRQRAEEVKRGVWQAGGFPLEMPAIALAEVFQKPTTMLYRNLLAMETEELLRSYPVDGAVLMGGCDKTTPATADGRAQHEPAGDLHAGGPDAARRLARAIPGLGVRRLEVLGREARGQPDRRAMACDRGRHRALARHVHDDGNGVDDDLDRRSARLYAARRLVDPGGRLAARADGGRNWAARSSRWCGRT